MQKYTHSTFFVQKVEKERCVKHTKHIHLRGSKLQYSYLHNSIGQVEMMNHFAPEVNIP